MQESGGKMCELCKEPSKYCCPGCSRRTCSLKCVKLHKEKFHCTGSRDKTKFVPVEEFGNNELLNDYRFLEDVSRTIDNAERNRKTFGYAYSYLPKNLYKLKYAAKLRKTNLCLLPPVFMKRKKNTTYLQYRQETILWRIEWAFVGANVTYVDERINENFIINSCLDKYLLPESSDPEVQEALPFYQSFGHIGVAVLLKKEDDPSNVTRYYELNKNKSLKKNFYRKKIVEYPTFLVIPCYNLHIYDIVSQNDEIIANIKEEIVDECIKNNEETNSIVICKKEIEDKDLDITETSNTKEIKNWKELEDTIEIDYMDW